MMTYGTFFAVIGGVFLVIYLIFLIQQGRSIITDFSMHKDGYLFVIGSIFSFIMVAMSIYKKEIINRMELGIALWLTVGAIAFLGNISSLLYYYDMYTGVIPFVCLFIVGMITSFYTPSGFIGVLAADKKDIQIASLKLLLIVILAGLWSLYIRQYSNDIFLRYMPFLLLLSAYRRWGKQLRGEKVSPWIKFKFRY